MANFRLRYSFRTSEVLVEFKSVNESIRVSNTVGEHHVACITFNIRQKCHDGDEMYFPWLVSFVDPGRTRILGMTACGLSDDTVVRPCESSTARSDDVCVVRVQFCQPSGIPLFPYIVQSDPCDMVEITGLVPRMNAVQLYHRAVQYLMKLNRQQRKLNLARFLYRNKPKDYYNDIFLRHHGIMKPYIKDFTGDSKCPLSGQLKGLFFSSNVDNHTKEPLDKSAFGPYRFLVPLTALLRSLGRWKIYFADFYCMGKNKGGHHITLVLCKEGTEVNDMCKKYLLALPAENPFFRVQGSEFMVSSYFWVEVIYTEPINIQQMCQKDGAFMERVESTTRSLKAGIPKDPRCLVCNTAMYESWEALSASI